MRGGRAEGQRFERLWRAVLGDATGEGPSPDDVELSRILDATDPTALPPLYLACGTEDELFSGNERFVSEARGHGADVTWASSSGGHDWGFWDRTIQDVLAWLPLRSAGPAD